MDLRFHLEAFEFMILSFMWTKSWPRIIPFGLPLPPFFSLTLPKWHYKKDQKSNRNKSQKVFWRKTSACRDGSLKNQPN